MSQLYIEQVCGFFRSGHAYDKQVTVKRTDSRTISGNSYAPRCGHNNNRETTMRILCVHSGGGILRGSELALLDMLTAAQRQGHEIYLLCDQLVLRDRARELGIHTELVSRGEFMIDPPDYSLRLFGLAQANWQVRRHIRCLKPDVLYCNSGRALQMGILAARLTGTPVATHLHAPYNKRYLYLYGVTRADLVIHCSENIRAVHEQKAKLRRSVGLRNAVDERRFPSIHDLKAPKEPVIGFLGSLIHRKGVDVLLEAVKLLHTRGVRCKLKIGGADKDGKYELMARQIGVKADFVGEVNREDIADFFADVSVHALPSRMDAMPLTIIEAAYCGVPTVATDVGGISEALLDGALGLLYQKNTPQELSKHLEAAMSPDWLDRRSHIAQLARSAFSLPTTANRLCEMLGSIVEPPTIAPDRIRA